MRISKSEYRRLCRKSAGERPGPPADPMNGTERRYARFLELRRTAGEVLWYGYEPIRIKLAPRTWYTPDFVLLMRDGSIEIHEVKGFWRDDARVKFKVAATMLPFATFRAVRRDGDGWDVETLPRPFLEGGRDGED
jgi:hypothetical protein